jgi:MFS transporter, ACS family, glucarate transporter
MTRSPLDHARDLAPQSPADEAGEPTRTRYVVLAAACSLAIVTYILRVGFSSVSPNLKSALGLSSSELGYVMAAFMVAYGLFEVPWGILGDQFGVRRTLALVALGASISTLAIALLDLLPKGTSLPLLIRISPPLALLILLRFSFGAFQAGTFPGISRMLADWMPTSERGIAQGMIWTSSRVGGAVAPLILIPLASRFPVWSGPLVLASLFGIAWCLIFWPWFRNRPEESRSVNRAELKIITAGRVGKRSSGHSAVPWGRMLRSRSAWALCLMYGFLGYSGNFFLTMLPDYLTKRGLPSPTLKWLLSLPFACGIVACLLGGWLSDRIGRRWGSRRWGRRAVGAFGQSLGSLAFLGTLLVTDHIALGALLCLTFFGNDLSMAPAWAAATDIGERHAGTLSGAMNMLASFFAGVGAMAAGALMDRGLMMAPIYLNAASYALGALCWFFVDVDQTLAEPE